MCCAPQKPSSHRSRTERSSAVRFFSTQVRQAGEFCVDDVCVTPDEFLRMKEAQPAAAGSSLLGEVETPSGSSAPTAEVDADTVTSTTPSEPLTASNDNEPAA